MKRALCAAWLVTFLAAAFFFYALGVYLRSGRPPAAPIPHGASGSSPAVKSRAVLPSSRYAPLLAGGLFFPPTGEKGGETAREPGTYVSSLALRGIVLAEGRPPMAVLTRANAPPTGESWTVRVGETVLGETVVAIDRQSVTLRKEGKETVLVLAE
ncbi:MAG: hypothetical protein ACUVRM_05225 [Bacillota bacterium]